MSNRTSNRPTDLDEAHLSLQEPRYASPARAPIAANNPFDRAAADLAAAWDTMVAERDTARDEAELHRNENLHLSATVDRLTKELASLTAMADLERDRLTKRADEAVRELADQNGKFEIIADAIGKVIEQKRNRLTEQLSHKSSQELSQQSSQFEYDDPPPAFLSRSRLPLNVLPLASEDRR